MFCARSFPRLTLFVLITLRSSWPSSSCALPLLLFRGIPGVGPPLLRIGCGLESVLPLPFPCCGGLFTRCAFRVKHHSDVIVLRLRRSGRILFFASWRVIGSRSTGRGGQEHRAGRGGSATLGGGAQVEVNGRVGHGGDGKIAGRRVGCASCGKIGYGSTAVMQDDGAARLRGTSV